MVDYVSRQVEIAMSAETVAALTHGGFSLFVLKGVNAPTDVECGPLLWFRSRKFLQKTLVAWTDRFQIYNSSSPITPNGLIVPSSSADWIFGMDIDENGELLGQEWDLRFFSFYGVSFNNPGPESWTSGLSQCVDGQCNPFCAVSVRPNAGTSLSCKQTMVLMFAVDDVKNGTVVTNAFAAGVALDYASSPPQPSFSFDIDTGWTWSAPVMATAVSAGQILLPLLCDSSP